MPFTQPLLIIAHTVLQEAGKPAALLLQVPEEELYAIGTVCYDICYAIGAICNAVCYTIGGQTSRPPPPGTTIHVSSYYYMCPHTMMYVPAYYYICVLTVLLYM